MTDPHASREARYASPCPFCGNGPEHITVGYNGQPATSFYVVCMSCQARGPEVSRDGSENLWDVWNNRSPSPGMPVYAPIKMSEIRLHVGEGSLPAWAVLEGVNIILRKRTDDARSAGNKSDGVVATTEERSRLPEPVVNESSKAPSDSSFTAVDETQQNEIKQRIRDLVFKTGNRAGTIAEEIDAIAALAGNAQGAEPVASPTDASLKPIIVEYLCHRGERPHRILRGGQALWETHLSAFRAALATPRAPSTAPGKDK